MTKRDSDAPSDDGIVSEDITQLMEHVELTGERRVMTGPGWEMATPADDLEDAPIFVDDDSEQIPDLEAVDVGEDIELFTETELDLNRRLSQVEDEQLELAAGIGAERARWQRRVASLRADLTERNSLIAEREQEIEDLSARLAMRGGRARQLRRGTARTAALRRAGRGPGGATRAVTGGQSSSQASTSGFANEARRCLVAREEIDACTRNASSWWPSIAERDEFFQRLHVKLREMEGTDKGGGELRKLLRRFIGGEQKTETAAAFHRPWHLSRKRRSWKCRPRKPHRR